MSYLPGLSNGQARHVHRSGGVGVGGGRLALELRLDLERLVARDVRPLGLPPARGRHVDRGRGVGDLGPRRREQAEAQAVLAHGELRDRGREHRTGLRKLLAQVDQRLPGGARELLRPRLRGRLVGAVLRVVAAATTGHDRAREKDGGDRASWAHGRPRVRNELAASGAPGRSLTLCSHSLPAMSSDARAALITGGSGGIGLAIARALGQDGYRVTVSARRPEKLEAAAQSWPGRASRSTPIAANMADEDDIKKTVDGPSRALRPPRRADQQRGHRHRLRGGGHRDQEARPSARREPARGLSRGA